MEAGTRRWLGRPTDAARRFDEVAVEVHRVGLPCEALISRRSGEINRRLTRDLAQLLYKRVEHALHRSRDDNNVGADRANRFGE